MRQGTRIPYIKKGGLMGWRKGNKVIAVINALLCLGIYPKGRAKLTFGDENAALDLSGIASDAEGGLQGPFLFKSKEDSWIVCRSWDGSTEGDTDILIALPPKLRAVGSEVIDGDTVTYSAYDNGAQTRHADNGTDEEDQVITPRFLVDDLIYANTALTLVDDDDGNPIPLLMDNTDGRAWLEVRDA